MTDAEYFEWRQRVWDTTTLAQLDRVAADFRQRLPEGGAIDADEETILDYIGQRAVVLGA